MARFRVSADSSVPQRQNVIERLPIRPVAPGRRDIGLEAGFAVAWPSPLDTPLDMALSNTCAPCATYRALEKSDYLWPMLRLRPLTARKHAHLPDNPA